MSSSQRLYELGACLCLYGKHHAPTFTCTPEDPYLPRAIREIRSETRHARMLIVCPEQKENTENGIIQLKTGDYHLATSENFAAVLFHESGGHGIQTICMPTSDHPFIGVQYFAGTRLHAIGAGRGLLPQLYGPGSVIAQLLGFGHQIGSNKMRFILSAGIGPCCFTKIGMIRHDLGEVFGVSESVDDFFRAGERPHTYGLDLLRVIEAEIRRASNELYPELTQEEIDAGKESTRPEITYHPRDTGCSRCTEHNHRVLYGSKGDSYNLAVFYSERKPPTG